MPLLGARGAGSARGFGFAGKGAALYLDISTTGATVTEDGDFKVAKFNGSGSLTVNALGADPTYGDKVEYVVVAGGGSNGTANLGAGGGGGAGGFLSSPSFTVSATTYTVTVGAGGAGVNASPSGKQGNSGSNSSFGPSVTAIGGGGGGSGSNPNQDALTGGSGGGRGIASDSSPLTASGTPGQGNSGGNTFRQDLFKGSPAEYSGGGGGAGGAGSSVDPAPGFSPSINQLGGGRGGTGVSTNITGSTLWLAGGGGGSRFFNTAPSYPVGRQMVGGRGGANPTYPGDPAGGANGFTSNVTPAPSVGLSTAAPANRGGGGGGMRSGFPVAQTAPSGGSGTVIVRWKFK